MSYPLSESENPLFPVEVGDTVIYNPKYHVDGVWLEKKGTEMVVFDYSEGYLWVGDITWAGFYAHEVPYGQMWKLNRHAFLPYKLQPAWEV